MRTAPLQKGYIGMNEQEINGEAFEDIGAATGATPTVERDEFAGDYKVLRIGHTVFTTEAS